MSSENDISEKIKEIVIAKIESNMSSNLKLSIGSYGTLTKEQLIEHVRKGDEVGKQIVKAHMSFLKAIANGELVKGITSIDNE